MINLQVAYITDTHWRAQTPFCRLDKDYLQSCLAEYEEFLVTCTANKVELIIHCGDIFDHYEVSFSCVSAFADLINKYQIKHVCSLGQHDCQSRNYHTWKSVSALGLLSRMAPVEVLDGTNTSVLYHYKNSNTTLKLHSWNYDDPKTKEALKTKHFSMKIRENCFNIGMFHTSISKKNDTLKNQYDVHDFNFEGIDLCLFGDIHNFIINEDKFLATGAWARKSIEDISRKNHFYILEFINNELVKTQKYYSSFKPPFKEIAQKKKVSGKTISDLIKQAKRVKHLSPKQRIYALGKAKQIDKDVIDLAVKLLDEE